MSEQEKRSLDAWIAENIFGKSPMRSKVKWNNEDGTPDGWGRWGDPFATNGNWPLPYYSKDKSAAFEVLEKCHSNSAVPILTGVAYRGHYCTTLPIHRLNEFEFSETLQLAICKCAQKLFSQSKGQTL